jgi:DNA-binding transcriptional regulator YiaG
VTPNDALAAIIEAGKTGRFSMTLHAREEAVDANATRFDVQNALRSAQRGDHRLLRRIIMTQAHRTKVGRYVVVDSGDLSTDHMADGTPILSAEMVSALERRATITVLRDVELVSGEELRFARKVLGLRQAELAEELGVAVETVSRWETGADAFKRPIQLGAVPGFS